MAKVLILIGAHLSTAPRAYKEASTLASAGAEVTVRGVWYDETLVQRDKLLLEAAPFRFAPALDLRRAGLRATLRNTWERSIGRLARETFLRSGAFSPALLGYGARAMLDAAIEHRADLTIVHSEAGLWVGSKLLETGLAVGVDFDDWFSEDLLPQDRAHRPTSRIKELERELAKHCLYCVTTSYALAEALATEYDAPEPTVIYNAFPMQEGLGHGGEIRDRRQLDLPSLHWFSQTIGPGRGLELLCAALPYLSRPVELHLRGALTDDRRAWLDTLVPLAWRQKVFVHSTVPNAELPHRIAEHDIGLALEIPYCANKDLTVSNKLFHYLQAGIAIVATDTAGQREVMAKCPGAGAVVPADAPHLLAASINRLLDNPGALRAAKLASARAGQALSWESQQEKLLDTFNSALVLRPK